jgi:pimeloyl-ACP methyl ester carboxylesterase
MTDSKKDAKKMTQSVGGAMEGEFNLTPSHTEQRETIFVMPPNRVIPIIFLPGVMGSNLRLSKARTAKVGSENDIAWRPDTLGATTLFTKVKTASFLTPQERQMKLDPDETEVDYYRFTENQGRFDPGGDQTQTSDNRHSNVPDSLRNVGMLTTDRAAWGADNTKKSAAAATAAQKARWRGWSEIGFNDYRDALEILEGRLYHITDPYYAQVSHNPLHEVWVSGKDNGRSVTGVNLAKWGAPAGKALEESEILRIANCLYPVHAMGYNWLQSNAISARKTAARIKALIKSYQDHGQQCDKVILVTHSMGGILARAIIHPEMGGLNDAVLGIYHSVQPVHGAGAAYKRVRSGVTGNSPAALVIGNTGQDVTAVFANAPGPLELLPTPAYGQSWLKVVDQNDRVLAQWPTNTKDVAGQPGTSDAPQTDGTPLKDIYLQDSSNWWRLINPDWINPAGKKYKNSSAWEMVKQRIIDAQDFHHKIKDTFHANTYASYGTDTDEKNLTHGNVTYKVDSLSKGSDDIASSTSPGRGAPSTWKIISEDGKGDLIVMSAEKRKFMLKLLPPKDAGDGTVPTDYSAAKIKAKIHFKQTGYDHQSSYHNDLVLASMLYSVVKIANTAEGWKK